MASRQRREWGRLVDRLATAVSGGRSQPLPPSRSGAGLSIEDVQAGFRAVILAGDAQAMFELAHAYRALDDPYQVYRSGYLYWLRRAAVLGHMNATAALIAEFSAAAQHAEGPSSSLYGLGDSHYPERGDSEEARYWSWRLAAARGDDENYTRARQLEAAGERGRAETFYRKVANAGSSDSAYRLARLAARRGDDESAKSWLLRASQQGDFRATVLLEPGFVNRITGTLPIFASWEYAAHRVSELAVAGDVDCAYVLAKCRWNVGEEARRIWLLRAAEAGDADAAYELGNELDLESRLDDRERAVPYGFGPFEYQSSHEWCWRLAAQQGHSVAAYRLSLALAMRHAEDESARWLDAAADAGHQQALQFRRVLIGASVASGPGEQVTPFEQAMTRIRNRQYAEAQHLLTELATAGNTDAMFNLGVLAEQEGAHKEALRWFAVAAEASDLEACYRYGVLLAHAGRASEAEPWLRKAADAGIRGAICRLGILRFDAGDEEAARDLWQSAALLGDPESAFRLALLFEHEGEVIEAKRLYRRAASQGHADARRRYGDLVLRDSEIDDVECTWELVRRQIVPPKSAPAADGILGAGYRPFSTRENEVDTYGDSVSTAAARETPAAETPPVQGNIQELLDHWDALRRLAPDPGRAISFLTQHGDLPRYDVDHVRRVRNQCAHPTEKGWPSEYDIDKALVIARELRRRLHDRGING